MNLIRAARFKKHCFKGFYNEQDSVQGLAPSEGVAYATHKGPNQNLAVWSTEDFRELASMKCVGRRYLLSFVWVWPAFPKGDMLGSIGAPFLSIPRIWAALFL